ncbi:MAG: hypothetical protein RLY83_567 [Actinomycetota bacterium]
MPFQLNPSKVPIWDNETDLRFGLNDETQVLKDVSNAQERLINLLFQGIPEDQLGLIGESVGLNSMETETLVERLKPSLLNATSVKGSGTAIDVRFAEIIRIGFETNNTPESVLANRAETLIQLPSLNRTGLLLIKALSETGFRVFETLDYEVVRREDLGELSYQPNQLGISKLAAARQLLDKHSNQLLLVHPDAHSKKKPKVIALSAMHRINPSSYRELMAAHIAVEYGISYLRVSPVIVPGESACLGCRDLWESESNPAWASVAIQLTARNDHLDDGAGLLFATAIAAKSICQYVDGSGLSEPDGFQVSLKTRAVQNYSWAFHPNCYCKTKLPKLNR